MAKVGFIGLGVMETGKGELNASTIVKVIANQSGVNLVE